MKSGASRANERVVVAAPSINSVVVAVAVVAVVAAVAVVVAAAVVVAVVVVVVADADDGAVCICFIMYVATHQDLTFVREILSLYLR